MLPDKSPRPDGLNTGFYQHFWSKCGNDVFIACNKWLSDGCFTPSINSTSIALIRKCDYPQSMRVLRPISLCNVIYKIISKPLANMLAYVIDKCVSKEQSAFVGGRFIVDNALVATEIIHFMHCKQSGKVGEAGMKLDISKAYDRVSWDYLRAVLDKMGFTNTWINWVYDVCFFGTLLHYC